MTSEIDALKAQIDRLQSTNTRITTLLTMSRELNRAQNEHEILASICSGPAMLASASATLYFIETSSDNTPTHIRVIAHWQADEQRAITLNQEIDLVDFPEAEHWVNDPGKPLYLLDATNDVSIKESTRQRMIDADFPSIVFLPVVQNDRWIAAISVQWRSPRTLDAEERAVLEAIPEIAAPAIENLRLIDELASVVVARTTELERLLDSAHDAIFSTDLDGVILSWNQAAVRIYGWDDSEVVGQPITIIYADDMLREWRDIIVQQTMIDGVYEGNHDTLRKDATPIIQQLRTALLRDDANNPVAITYIASDITEVQTAREEHEALQAQIIEAQRRAIQDLSSPIIPIIDRIIVMPLIGQIDSHRALEIMRALLAGVSAYNAQVVIIDITGVPLVDSSVADYLNRTVKAARLKGAHTIITGISPAVAETIVNMGIDWTNLETLRDLQTGLMAALKQLNFRLIPSSQRGT